MLPKRIAKAGYDAPAKSAPRLPTINNGISGLHILSILSNNLPYANFSSTPIGSSILSEADLN